MGTAGSSGVWNYIQSYSGVTFNGAYRKGSGTKNADGASSATGNGAWDFALTGSGDTMGIDGVAWGVGYGEASNQLAAVTTCVYDDNVHYTGFLNYSTGPVTLGYQQSQIDVGTCGGTNKLTEAWGIAFNVNDDLSVSYGEREVEFGNDSAAHVTEDTEGLAIAYTMGSMKIAGNNNEISNSQGATGAAATDEMTEIAVSFAF